MILKCIPFDYTLLRTFAHDGARWFVLPDLCRAIGVAAQEVATRLEDYECAAVELRAASGPQEVVLAVNVAGLHTVLSHGRKRSRARAFKRWLWTRSLRLLPPYGETNLPRSRYEIVTLPPRADEGLTSTTEIADAIGYAPTTLGRMAGHLKAPQHGEFRPAVAHHSNRPVQQWWWNEEGRRAVLKEFH